MTIVKKLDDGSFISFRDNTDPDFIARRTKEKNLAIAQEKGDISRVLGPDYNPGETIEKDAITPTGFAGRGALSGLVSLVSEPVETAGYLAQLTGQEQLGQELVKRAEAVKQTYAPDIEGGGLSAEVPKALVQFGVPATFVLKAMKGRGKIAQAVALGLGEAIFASSDMESMGDSFIGVGPTLTKELDQLEGQEKAFQALLNKGKIGLEASALTLGIPAMFSSLGAAFGTAASIGAKVPGVQEAAQGLKDFSSYVGDQVDSFLKSRPDSYIGDKGAALFRYRGALPTKEAAEIRDARAIEFGALAAKNQLALDEINQTMSLAFKSGKDNSVAEKNIMDALDNYLFPADDILEKGSADYAQAISRQEEAAKILVQTDKDLGWVSANLTTKTNVDDIVSDYSLFRAAKRARETIDEYSERINLRPEFLPEGAKDTIAGQLGLYATRQYRAFLDDSYVPTEEVAERALQTVMAANKKSGIEITREEGIKQLNDLKSAKGFANSSLNPQDLVEDQVLSKVNDGILKGRALNSESIREYLGEYTTKAKFAGRELSVDERKKNLMVKVKETVGRQSAIITKGNFITNLKKYNDSAALPNDKKIFLDAPPLTSADDYVKLSGVGYGPVSGKYVKKSYLEALEKNKDGFYQKIPLFGEAYGAFLGAKGVSQLGKTVYNVVGQIRNVTSAMGFAIANGNLPNMKTFSESWTLVGSNVMRRFPKDADRRKLFEFYQSKGIVGQQAQLGELNSLIDEAAKAGGATGKLFSSKFMQAAQNNIMTRLYQGGDDVWRIFNFESELQKLNSMVRSSQAKQIPYMVKATTSEQIELARRAGLDPNNFNIFDLRNEGLIKNFLEDQAAVITRDVVPNYERVPEIVRMIRRTPFGNFIAYPAEIIRTSVNILEQAIKEVASSNSEVRARGMERLLGFGAITTGIPAGVQATGMMLTGTNQEQLNAYLRSFAWPWEKTATMIPIGTDKDGNITEVINLSYTMPYDFLARPFRAVQQSIDNGQVSEKENMDILNEAVGMMYNDMFSPFLGESLLTERVLDVFTRNGETKFGTRIWNPNENVGAGEKAYAGIAHIFNGLVPSLAPAELNPKVSLKRAYENVPGDGTLGDKITQFGFRAFNVRDLPRSVLVESQLVDPQYRVSDRGEQVDFFSEMTQGMSGVKTVKIDVEKKLKYQAFEAAREIASASQELRALRKAYGKRVPEEFANAYKRSNEIRYKALKELSVAIDDAEYLGLKKGDIAQILSDAKVKNYQNVMNNEFIPYSPPPEIFFDAYEASETKIRNVPDMGPMYQDYGQRSGQQLSPPIQRPQVVPGQGLDLRLFSDKSEGTQLPLSQEKRASNALKQKELNKLLGLDD